MSTPEDELSFIHNVDSAMPSLIEHWRLHRRTALLSEQTVGVPFIGSTASLYPPTIALAPDVLVQAVVLNLGPRVAEGRLVDGVAIAWFEIISQLERDPEFLFKIPPRKLEEIIAGAYEREGWSDVILTPQSGDGGRDVIASRTDFGSIRILDQAKAYRRGSVVTADDVRAMLGVLTAEQNVSKGLVTTTSSFAPGIEKDARLQAFMPNRLELKNGSQLRTWLLGLTGSRGRPE